MLTNFVSRGVHAYFIQEINGFHYAILADTFGRRNWISTKERTYRSALKKLVQMVDNQEEKIPRMLLQTFYDDFKAYTSKVYSPETVTVQDRGFMWFGTRQGFCRYDGDAKVVHKGNELDSTSISDNIIIALVEDDKNTTRMQLWDSLFTDSLLTFS